MAKATDTEATDEFAGIVLEEYNPPSVEGVYDREVRAMLAADERLSENDPEAFESGKRTAVKILSANDDKAKAKTVRDFQDSARPHNRTARKVNEAPQGSDGQIALTFILVPKQTRDRKPKPATSPVEAAPDDSDVPASGEDDTQEVAAA